MKIGDLAQREGQKRERCCDPLQRWKIIQETIAWVDSQQPIPRNSRQACLAKQAMLLKGLAEFSGERSSQKQ